MPIVAARRIARSPQGRGFGMHAGREPLLLAAMERERAQGHYEEPARHCLEGFAEKRDSFSAGPAPGSADRENDARRAQLASQIQKIRALVEHLRAGPEHGQGASPRQRPSVVCTSSPRAYSPSSRKEREYRPPLPRTPGSDVPRTPASERRRTPSSPWSLASASPRREAAPPHAPPRTPGSGSERRTPGSDAPPLPRTPASDRRRTPSSPFSLASASPRRPAPLPQVPRLPRGGCEVRAVSQPSGGKVRSTSKPHGSLRRCASEASSYSAEPSTRCSSARASEAGPPRRLGNAPRPRSAQTRSPCAAAPQRPVAPNAFGMPPAPSQSSPYLDSTRFGMDDYQDELALRRKFLEEVAIL